MSNRNVSVEERVEELIQFASWLKEEAQALKRVIEEVPYQDQMPDRKSIEEELIQILQLQESYYRPIFDSIRSPDTSNRIPVRSLEKVLKDSEEASKPIEVILDQLAEQRTHILDTIDGLSADDWDKSVDTGSFECSLLEIAEEMVERDLDAYKRLADLAKTFQQESEAKRELKGRHPGRDTAQNENPLPSARVE